MSLTKVPFSMIEGASANVLDYGADPTGVADSTSAIQAALDSGAGSVYLPEGTYLFSTLTVNKNTRLHGASTRTSILKHTGAATAIQCVYSGSEPDGRGTYIEAGWFIFEDFELMANGTFGFRVGKTRSSFTMFNRLYMRHRRDLESGNPNAQYFAGSVAIDCDNNPWTSSYSTYMSKVHHCFIRGFETAVNLQATVNAWEINRLYTIECYKQVVLSAATGISTIDCYFESGAAGATGFVFLGGGGNQINIIGTTFELTNAAATQYAYSFAGGTWETVTVIGAKYLIQGDGNSINARRISGTAPTTFVEYSRTITSPTYGLIPMVWAPGCSTTKPFQQPNYSRLGGLAGGNGRLLLGRDSTDTVDGYVENDGAYGLTFVAPGSGSTVDFTWSGRDLTPHLEYQGYSGGVGQGFYSGFDNAIPLGQASRRWSVVYAGTGTINTSDEREKQDVAALNDAEKRVAAKLKGLIRKFKFRDAVAAKGAQARIHVGVIAQDVAKAFESEGLNANDYGVFCYDEWPEQPEKRDDKGNIVVPHKPAGNRYGVRYEELLAFIIAA